MKFKEIFEAAVETPRSGQSDFLALACAGNEEMRGEIEKLLRADDLAGSFLESSPFNESNKNPVEIRTQNYIGQKIGAYKIERAIGAGGMGTVFLAERVLGDLHQKAAVKIVNQGAFSQEIIRRFSIERRILATLEHSGIARLIDAGETAEGLPFLVMEYVEGKPLDEHCREQNLTIEECLKLFCKVCAAVAFAHRRLIVHRDLKPSNILVTVDDYEPKLLDFGIAKLLAPDDPEISQTATLMNLLTPAYASPEQIRGETVTTASDVYSLGVILYELLTGVRPFVFDNKNYQEIVRVICETEPPRPSEAHQSTVDNYQSSADKSTNKNKGRTNKYRPLVNAKSEVGNPKFLRGDLDNIILKALRKDPERRYQAVEQFSEDIERYLKGLPVSARPDTFTYRASKFFERNRIAVISFGAILLLIIGGIFTTTWQALRAARQQEIAEQRFAQVREIANNVIFKYHDSIANLKGSTEVRKMLVEDATKYLDALAEESDADENLQNELALAYAKLADVQGKPFSANTGDTSGALENYRKSIELFEKLAQSKNAANASKAEEGLITTYHGYSALNSRAFNFDEAISSQKTGLDLARKHLAQDSQDLKRRLTVARADLWLGDAYSESGNFTEAVSHYRGLIVLAEEIYESAPHEKDAKTILGVAHDRIGRAFLLRGQELARTDFPADEISEIYRESYVHLKKTSELFKVVADENPDDRKYQRNFIVAQSNLGMALRNVGQYSASLELLQKVAENTEHNLEKDAGNHQLEADHAEDLHQLGLSLNAENKSGEAVEKFQYALQTMDKLIAEDAGNMEFQLSRLEMANDYGRLLFKVKDISGALKIYQIASKKIAESEKTSTSSFSSFAKGMINENVGNCYEWLARNAENSKTRRDADLEKSKTYYRNAVNLWQMPEVRRRFLSRTPEIIEYLNRKLSRLEGSKIIV